MTQNVGLMTSSALGVLGAADALVMGTPPAELIAAVGAELSRRQAELTDVEATIGASASDTDQINRIQAVFGEDFLVGISFAPSDAASWSAAIANGSANISGLAARIWLQRAARVRRGASSLNRLFVAAAATGIASTGALQVVQLPTIAGEPWVGDRFASGSISGPRLNLVLVGPGPGTTAMTGLTIDDWVETLPATMENTGLAFHYETPVAQAPQSALVAVAADLTQPQWTSDLLESTLLDALQLAKIRTVDPDCLGLVGQMLPALYFANNVSAAGPSDTVSTEFFPASAGSSI